MNRALDFRAEGPSYASILKPAKGLMEDEQQPIVTEGDIR